MTNILIIEDDLEVAALIKDVFDEDSDLNVEIHTEPKELLNLANIDMILLDENLNGRSGLDYIESLKQTNTDWNGLIVVITGSDQDDLIKKAFALGVDDYITKPFKPLVLRGKIRALLARIPVKGRNMISINKIQLEPSEHRIRIDGEEVFLTLTEYKILRELIQNAGKLVTRENLKERVYGDLFVTNRTIDVHICSLRKKMKTQQNLLKTVRGVGYRLTP